MSAAAAAKRFVQRRALCSGASRRAEGPVLSVWQVREAADENYRRCVELLGECETAADRARVLGEIRQHIALAAGVMERAYSVRQAQAFMEEVLMALQECAPETRDRVLFRVSELRGEQAISARE